MSNTPNIDELKHKTSLLLALLSDPHPGLSTWCSFVAQRIEEIAEFHPKQEPKQEWQWRVRWKHVDSCEQEITDRILSLDHVKAQFADILNSQHRSGYSDLEYVHLERRPVGEWKKAEDTDTEETS